MPQELNLFDTIQKYKLKVNILGVPLEKTPLWDRFLKSLCIEVLQNDQNRTETVVVIAIAIIPVEGQQAGIITIPIIASTFEERIIQCWEVRVVRLNP